jgi:type II secretory pathway component PulM
MKAQHYAPIAPLETEPLDSYTEPEQREEALRDALRGVELGTYDQRMIDWCVKRFDNSALRVLVSWLERVRQAGVVDVLEIDRARRGNRGRFSR